MADPVAKRERLKRMVIQQQIDQNKSYWRRFMEFIKVRPPYWDCQCES